MSMRDISTEDMVLEIHTLRELNKSLSAALSLSQKREKILLEVVVEVKKTSKSVLQAAWRAKLNKYFLFFARLATEALDEVGEGGSE